MYLSVYPGSKSFVREIVVPGGTKNGDVNLFDFIGGVSPQVQIAIR